MRLAKSRWWWIVAILAFTGWPFFSCAQDSSDCRTRLASPGDLSLRLAVDRNQPVFQEGEITRLRAGYATGAKAKYILNNRSYDRSGRLGGMEVFCIEPASENDPLRDYFNSAQGFLGGGLYSEQQLRSAPTEIGLELNEWETLLPGRYTVFIVGYRVATSAQHR